MVLLIPLSSALCKLLAKPQTSTKHRRDWKYCLVSLSKSTPTSTSLSWNPTCHNTDNVDLIGFVCILQYQQSSVMLENWQFFLCEMPKKRNAFFKTVFSLSQCQQEGGVLFGSAAFLGYSLVNRYFPKKLKYLKLLQLSLLTLEIVNSCACCLLHVDLTLNRESIKDRKEHSLRNMFTTQTCPCLRCQCWGIKSVFKVGLNIFLDIAAQSGSSWNSRHWNCYRKGSRKLSNDSKYEIFKQFWILNQTISNMELSNNLKYQIFKQFQILILLIVRVEVNQ